MSEMHAEMSSVEVDQPLVSVVITAYRHEAYIAECIESALAQVTAFPVEILIGVDDGGDKTLDICLAYARQYPERIHVFVNDPANVLRIRGRRVGRYNFLNVYYKARGKYIAICDGDDYWCDNNKLQKQVNVLEAHPAASACHHWHHYAIADEQGIYRVQDAPKTDHGYLPDEMATVRDVFANRLRLKSRTVMYRNTHDALPELIREVAYADVALSVIYGMQGNFRFIDEPMAVYRLTGAGVSTTGYGPHFDFQHRVDYIDLWEKADIFVGGAYRQEALETILYYYKAIFFACEYIFPTLLPVLKYSLFQSNYPVRRRLEISRHILRDYFKNATRKKRKKKLRKKVQQ